MKSPPLLGRVMNQTPRCLVVVIGAVAEDKEMLIKNESVTSNLFKCQDGFSVYQRREEQKKQEHGECAVIYIMTCN